MTVILWLTCLSNAHGISICPFSEYLILPLVCSKLFGEFDGIMGL
jgi:hypothetical protein